MNYDEMSAEELGKMFPVILAEHDKNWMVVYESEKSALLDILKDGVIRINHIGSTAVTGLVAKPTIDILLEIKKDFALDKLSLALQTLDYIGSEQKERPAPHLMFMKGYSDDGFKGQVFHLHVRYAGDWDELYFRDYLIDHDDVAKAYGDLKKKLQQEYRYNREDYTNAKTDFVAKVTKQAKETYRGRYEVSEC